MTASKHLLAHWNKAFAAERSTIAPRTAEDEAVRQILSWDVASTKTGPYYATNLPTPEHETFQHIVSGGPIGPVFTAWHNQLGKCRKEWTRLFQDGATPQGIADNYIIPAYEHIPKSRPTVEYVQMVFEMWRESGGRAR